MSITKCMEHEYCIWVDGCYLSSWPKENYIDVDFENGFIEGVLVFGKESDAQNIRDVLIDKYQWNNAEELIKIVEVYKKTVYMRVNP